MHARPALAAALVLIVATLLAPPATAAPSGPEPGTPEYLARDLANIEAANGRNTAPDGAANDPDYAPAAARAAASGAGEEHPYRFSRWHGIRGRHRDVTFADSATGGVFDGRVYAPLQHATHPDTGRRLTPPYPGVVIVPGTNADAASFAWAAEDLAERGYVALTFTVTGQQGAPRYFAAANDAIDFFWSTDNPYRGLFDRAPQEAPATPGRPYRFAVMGHSVGALVAAPIANLDPRVSVLVAWDKLTKSKAYAIGGTTVFDPGDWGPAVPALGVHSEYFLTPTPYTIGCALPAGCEAYLPTEGPDPDREISMGYGGDDGWGLVPPQPGGWAETGVDVMHLVLRSSTHNEFVNAPNARASRFGQAVTSYYQTAWLDRYLKQDRSADRRLAATSFRWLEPRAQGWRRTPLLERDHQLSFYFCSAWRYHTTAGALVQQMDPTGAGCAGR